jgi:hypothetical protein
MDIDTGKCIVKNIFFENKKILLEEFFYNPFQHDLIDVTAKHGFSRPKYPNVSRLEQG